MLYVVEYYARVWIGLYDSTGHHNWIWWYGRDALTNDTSWSSRNEQEPDHTPSNSPGVYCAEQYGMGGDGLLNDESCVYNRCNVCEFDI